MSTRKRKSPNTNPYTESIKTYLADLFISKKPIVIQCEQRKSGTISVEIKENSKYPFIQFSLHPHSGLLDKNLIGQVRTVHIHCQMFKPDKYFKKASWKKNDGAGPIFVNLIHDLDLMNYFFGKVKTVFANICTSKRGFKNEDVSGAILEFKNGIMGTFLCSDSVLSPWSWELTARENDVYPNTEETCYFIGGTKGSLSLPNLKIWHHKNGHWMTPISSTKYPFKISDPLVNQIEHFSNVIQKKEKPIITASIANETIKVIEAIKLSAKNKKIVKLI